MSTASAGYVTLEELARERTESEYQAFLKKGEERGYSNSAVTEDGEVVDVNDYIPLFTQ